MLHYNPQHVSSSTLLIFRRTNCIITASGVPPPPLLDISIIPYIGTEGLSPESKSSSVLIFAKHETLNCLLSNGPRSQLVD